MLYKKRFYTKKRYRVKVEKDGFVRVEGGCCDIEKIKSKIIEQYQSYDIASQKGWITIYV